MNTVEETIKLALESVTGQELTSWNFGSTKSIWLNGQLNEHGDAAVFKFLPTQYVDRGAMSLLQCAEKFGAMLFWEDHRWTFSQGKAWRDGQEFEDTVEIQRVLEGWLSWLAERELRLLISKKVGFGRAKELLAIILEAKSLDK